MSPTVPDANTGLEALAAAQAARTFLGPLAERVLGPTAELLGEGLRGWTEKGRDNVARVFNRADERLTDEQRSTGSVPPKVLKAVIDEAAFCDDDLAASYFGGVLASSRSEVSRDDRGATLAALVGRLSTYEIRSHYLLYAHAQRRLAGTYVNFGRDTERQAQARVYVPMSVWINGMEFGSDEVGMIGDIIGDSIQGLLREDLIEIPFGYGGSDVLGVVGFAGEGMAGLAAQLTPVGVQLFVWAHGVRAAPYSRFADPDSEFSMPGMPELEAGSMSIADMQAGQAPPSVDPPTTDPA
jgi:hypothetical protein